MSPFIVKEQRGIPSQQEPQLGVSDFFTGAAYASSLNAGVAQGIQGNISLLDMI